MYFGSAVRRPLHLPLFALVYPHFSVSAICFLVISVLFSFFIEETGSDLFIRRRNEVLNAIIYLARKNGAFLQYILANAFASRSVWRKYTKWSESLDADLLEYWRGRCAGLSGSL